jgi:hypothetical protein
VRSSRRLGISTFLRPNLGTLISTTPESRRILQYTFAPGDNRDLPAVPCLAIALATPCRRQQSIFGHECIVPPMSTSRIGRPVDRLQNVSHNSHNLDKLQYSLACAPGMVWPGRLTDYASMRANGLVLIDRTKHVARPLHTVPGHRPTYDRRQERLGLNIS